MFSGKSLGSIMVKLLPPPGASVRVSILPAPGSWAALWRWRGSVTKQKSVGWDIGTFPDRLRSQPGSIHQGIYPHHPAEQLRHRDHRHIPKPNLISAFLTIRIPKSTYDQHQCRLPNHVLEDRPFRKTVFVSKSLYWYRIWETFTSRKCLDASIPYSFLHSSWLWWLGMVR